MSAMQIPKEETLHGRISLIIQQGKIYNSEVLVISFCNNLCNKNETFELEA